jgi:coenzyme F420 hydrogenase subunit beta
MESRGIKAGILKTSGEAVQVEPNACQILVDEVIRKELCTLCGACVGLCPYFISHNGQILLRDTCDLSQGSCRTFCPRISLDLEEIHRSIFGIAYSWRGVGTYKTIFMARSTNGKIKARAQDAGAVTTFVSFAKDEGLIDSAVMTLFEDKSLPTSVFVSAVEEILACAGSSYVATPAVETFNRGIQEDDRKRIGFVGTPCQVLALAKMKASTPEGRNPVGKLQLVIGLFCTWALSHPGFTQFLERQVADPIVKYNIPPHPANVLQVYTQKKRIDISLEYIVPFIRPACQVCHDLTAEFADISVGSGRGEVLEWNTVIVRTPRGMEIVEGAKRKGLIEIREIPKENLDRLERASFNKKRRALNKIIQKTGSLDDLLYLKLQTEIAKQLIGE